MSEYGESTIDDELREAAEKRAPRTQNAPQRIHDDDAIDADFRVVETDQRHEIVLASESPPEFAGTEHPGAAYFVVLRRGGALVKVRARLAARWHNNTDQNRLHVMVDEIDYKNAKPWRP